MSSTNRLVPPDESASRCTNPGSFSRCRSPAGPATTIVVSSRPSGSPSTSATSAASGATAASRPAPRTVVCVTRSPVRASRVTTRDVPDSATALTRRLRSAVARVAAGATTRRPVPDSTTVRPSLTATASSSPGSAGRGFPVDPQGHEDDPAQAEQFTTLHVQHEPRSASVVPGEHRLFSGRWTPCRIRQPDRTLRW